MDTDSQPNAATESALPDRRESRTNRRLVFALLVSAQFSFLGAIVLTQSSPHDHLVALVVQLAGVAIGLSAILSMGTGNFNVSPTIRKGASLVVHGPYRFVRHPMYSALALFAGSFVLTEPTRLGLQLWLGLVVVLVIKSLYEDSLLKHAFPEYVAYAQTTKRFVPFVF